MLQVKDRIKELTTTSGTGTLQLSGTAEAGFQAFSILANNTKTYYTISDVNGTDFEVGEGTYNANTLTRDTIFESSNSGNAISLSATGSTVFVTYPAEKSSYRDIGVNRDYEASGSVGAGKPLILNADNTVSQVAESTVTNTTPTSIIDTLTTVNPSANNKIDIIYDTYNDKVWAYSNDGNNSSYPTVVVGDISSGTSITWGTPVTVTSNTYYPTSKMTQRNLASDNAGNILVAYRDSSNDYARVKIGNYSGTNSATFGNELQPDNISSLNTIDIGYCSSANLWYMFHGNSSSTKWVLMKQNSGAQTFSGWDVGTLYTGDGIVINNVYNSTNNKIIVGINQSSNGRFYVCNTTADGSTNTNYTLNIGAQQSVTLTGGYNSDGRSKIILDTTNNNYILIDSDNIAGMNCSVITESSATLSQSTPQNVSSGTMASNTAFYNPNNQNIFGAYQVYSSPYACKNYLLTVSGTTFTYVEGVAMPNATDRGVWTQGIYISDITKGAFVGQTNNGYDLLTSIISLDSTTSSNLTTDNFFGVASSTNTESVSFTITVQNVGGSNYYFVNGVRQQMPIALKKGSTYKFIQSDTSNSNHPLRFSTTNNGTWGGGTEYTSGVTVVGTPGQSGAYTQIVVADSTPSQLYSYCTNHSNMGFGISIISQPVGVNRAGSFNNDQTGMTAGKDMYVSSAGLIKERTTTTTTPDTNPSFNFQEATSNSTSTNPTSTYEATSGAYVIAWKENSNGYGYVMAGTISNGTMTWGTPTAFLSSAIDDVPNICSGDGAVHITYRSGTNGVIKWGTISGTTITLAVGGDLFNHGGSYSSPMGYRCAYDTANNYVMVFYSGGSGTQTAYVQPMYYNSSAGSYTGSTSSIVKSSIQILTTISEIVYDSDTERFVVFYRDTTNSNVGYANVIQSTGSSSSPTASVGSASQFTNGDQIVSYGNIGGVYDTQNDKIFIAWNNTDGSNPSWRGAIITVTGGATNTIASNGWADIWDYAGGGSTAGITFDSDKNKIMFYYRDDGNSDYLTYKTITSGASSFTVADGSVIKESDNQFQGNSPSFAPSKGVVLPTRDLGNSSKISSVTTYFASTTSTVVNGSQFVGTARSGTDLELSEPPTELVGFSESAITKGRAVVVKPDGNYAQAGITTTSVTNTGTASQGSLGSMGTYDSDMFAMAVAKDGLTYCFTFQNTSNGQSCKIGTRSGETISWGTELELSNSNSDSHFVSYNDEANVFLTSYTTGDTVKGTAVSFSGNTGTKGTEVTIMDLGGSSSSPSYSYQHWFDATNKVSVCWARGGVSGNYTNRSSAVALTITGTSISVGTLYENPSAGGSRAKGCDITNGKHVLYWSSSAGYPSTMTMTVTSSGAISWGTALVINSASCSFANPIYNPNYPNKVIIAGVLINSTYSYAGFNISGTTISTANFNSAGINNANSYIESGGNMGVYSNYSGNYCFVYQTYGAYNSRYNFATTTDGLTLTVATAVQTNSHGSSQFYAGACATDVDGVVVENHNNRNNSPGTYAYYCFNPTFNFTATTEAPNMTSANVIGIAQETILANNDIKVKTFGQVDENQSSLTTGSAYFVNGTTGAIQTTADDPSVNIGTALNSTNLLIKS